MTNDPDPDDLTATHTRGAVGDFAYDVATQVAAGTVGAGITAAAATARNKLKKPPPDKGTSSDT